MLNKNFKEQAMQAAQVLGGNNLLHLLPVDDFERLAPYLESVWMAQGEIIFESGDRLNYAYFPLTCTVSMASVMENGSLFETALIGNEGIVDNTWLNNETSLPKVVVVRSDGYALRLPIHFLDAEFNRTGGRRKGTLHQLLLRYTQLLIIQMAQTALCNRHHSIEQQLCRWLLISIDKQASNELNFTQESIAEMMGVRREAITISAIKLYKKGLVDYHRGHIRILNRLGLEERACDCYHLVKSESEKLFQTLS
jgi:CRP-like cAMP-binding protein